MSNIIIKISILCSALFSTMPTYTTIVVQGNDKNAPFGFTTPVLAKVFDRKNGFFFVGLNAGIGDAATGAFAISQATRPIFVTKPKFTGIAKNNGTVDLVDRAVEFLALLQQTNEAPILGIVGKEFAPFTRRFVTGLPTNGDNPAQSTNLNDATGAANTTGIVGIAARPTHIFAAVRPSLGNFGENNSGIALIDVTKTDDSVVLEAKDATTGMGGQNVPNKAQRLDLTSPQIKGTGNNVGNVIFSTDAADVDRVALHYDAIFYRLYIGLRIATNTAMNDIAKSVVTARIDENANNTLLLETIVADTALNAAKNEIVVAKNPGAASQNLRVKHIRTMHTTTGPSFLIINGGKDETDQIGNKIRALPLVNNPTNPTTHGTLADATQFNTANHVYDTPATNINQLFEDDTIEAIVGAGDLPMLSGDSISDIVVVGDTVYVSIMKTPSATNDSGIFYSQALFDDVGTIACWTPWTKRGVPCNAFGDINLPGNISHDGSIAFFDVDAKTGNIWIVEGTTGRVAGITSWATKNSSNGLITRLNQALSDGSFSVLDLDQATRGFLGNTEHRYALFGGNNKIVFTRTSQAQMATTESPQTVIKDFSSAQNFLVTELPEDAGCCRTLEYGRRLDDNNDNYFFAGTQNGLFAFADSNGAGFSVGALTTLDNTPFDGSWQKISDITDSVIDIKTSGRRLYVLVTEVTSDPKKPFISKLFAFNFATPLANFFTNPALLAQTGVGVFAKMSEFFGIQIIATGDVKGIAQNPEDKEQLILATNQGVFKSDANQNPGNGIIDATNQTDANWQQIANTTTFLGVAGVDTPVRHTVWPFSVRDERGFATFSRGSIHQLSGTGNDGGTAANISSTFLPDPFNASDTTKHFSTLEPIIYFWSDGGRRLFIVKPPNDPSTENKLSSLPFNVIEWNIGANTILTHPALQTVERFFWIKQIGVTGFLLAGMEKGVAGLG